MGSISVRKHIRWGSDAASEPTSTLVLTSPGRYFVDVRAILQEPAPETQTSASKAPKLRDLDWAFAGTSSTHADGHSVFKHWVDSRSTEPEKVRDEGDMAMRDDGTMLETGRMVNPATGVETDYEELWGDMEPRPYPSGGEDDGARVPCVVAQLHDDAHDARGIIIRLGQFIQGVLRTGETFTAGRWGGIGHADGARTLFKVGDISDMPFDALLAVQNQSQGTKWKKGDVMMAGDNSRAKWTVIEASGC